jgi:hypothetical protein
LRFLPGKSKVGGGGEGCLEFAALEASDRFDDRFDGVPFELSEEVGPATVQISVHPVVQNQLEVSKADRPALQRMGS